MDKVTWGCPACGSGDVVQHVKLSATREGRFRGYGNGWEFSSDSEFDTNSAEVDEEGDFECGSCEETFDKPVRLRQGNTIRLALRISASAFRPNANGVEAELEDDFSARFDTECVDEAQAKHLFEALRLFLKGIAASVTGGQEAA